MTDDMINNPDNPAFRTTVGPRGRVTLTAAVRAAAGLSEGDKVVVRAIAPGVVVVESWEAFRAGVVKRIRAGNPETLERLDAVEDTGCRCTGWEGCPNPELCGTPNGCHCGA